MKITLGVTTHNRAQSLDRLLKSFAELAKSNSPPSEVVIVANACTDNTVEVLEQYKDILSLKIIIEDRLGVAHGRNAVVKNATGDIILWTDDDITVGPDWVATYVELFEKHPDIDFFGGPIEPVFEGDAQPKWLKYALKHVPSSYAKLYLDKDSRPFISEDGEEPFGANMAIRRSVMEQEPFNSELGRVGHEQLSGGEETRMFRELTVQGRVGWWVTAPVVTHWIDEKRQTLAYLEHYWFWVGRNEQALRFTNQPGEQGISMDYVKKQMKSHLIRYKLAKLIGYANVWIPEFCNYHLQRGRMYQE